MKLTVIGFGQCGGKMADEFARLNKRARSQRRIEITPGVFAVNTDTVDLTGLSTIQSDYRHRILIGSRRTGGHGVGKINELAAEIAREDSDKIIEAIRSAKRFYETDAFLLIASAAGGTGSGAISVMTKIVKERYPTKPAYNLIILPFEHEETTEKLSTYNTALCLKSASQVADAVILVDNQRYVRKDASLQNNLSKINSLIVEPFYGLLCAGEEKKAKYIGSHILDAGDILQTLTGWSVVGYGKSETPPFRFPFGKSHFRDKGTQTHRGVRAMDEAVSELSVNCSPTDATTALYLLSAPSHEMNMDLFKELGDYMRGLAPQATIRSGDHPRQKGEMGVSVIFSGLSSVEKVKEYYTKSTSLIPEFKKRKQESAKLLHDLDETGKDLPSLI